MDFIRGCAERHLRAGHIHRENRDDRIEFPAARRHQADSRETVHSRSGSSCRGSLDHAFGKVPVHPAGQPDVLIESAARRVCRSAVQVYEPIPRRARLHAPDTHAVLYGGDFLFFEIRPPPEYHHPDRHHFRDLPVCGILYLLPEECNGRESLRITKVKIFSTNVK